MFKYNPLDELSTSDDEEIPYIVAKDEESAVLSTLLVLMRPIIMVNSTAHDERIKNEKNNLYISIINSEVYISILAHLVDVKHL